MPARDITKASARYHALCLSVEAVEPLSASTALPRFYLLATSTPHTAAAFALIFARFRSYDDGERGDARDTRFEG